MFAKDSHIIEAVYDFQLVYLRFLHLENPDVEMFKKHLEDLMLYGNEFLRLLGNSSEAEVEEGLIISLQYASHVLEDIRYTQPEDWDYQKFRTLKSLVLQFFEDVLTSPVLQPALEQSRSAS